jgi:3-oxoacyl-(acyl-carrier-protein) synthase
MPFNQASVQDVNKLVKHVYNKLELDVDVVVPFGAISENGRALGDVDGRSELAHRLMLTNVVRLVGAIKKQKAERGTVTRPAHVILPLSPNHGLFGNDGLYAESKIGLETLLNKRESEGWQDYINIVGAVIGWTRGTGLMAGNNMTAPGVEALGCWTFSTEEMALALIGLCHPDVVDRANDTSLLVDLSGGFDRVGNLNQAVSSIRQELLSDAKQRARVHADAKRDVDQKRDSPDVEKRVSFLAEGTKFPTLPKSKYLEDRAHLQGLLDLESVAVVIGFGEVGPWAGARTRWEMESYGELSLEGCVELAWACGLIEYRQTKIDGKDYAGWVSVDDGKPIAETAVKARYEDLIMSQCGIRLIDPAVLGFDPSQKTFMHHVAVDRDLPWVDTASKEEAMQFRAELGSKQVDVRHNDDGIWQIKLKKGATMSIPKAMRFDRFVAGQVPSGWDATRYGVPQDIINQVDRVTLFSLIAAAEAFMTAGVLDPYEFYQYVHVSNVGNTIGGGFGGMDSFREIFSGRKNETTTQGDVLQESFINTVPAWINMLLLSASGPIRTPVGACATAAESVELAVEAIERGTARVVICGGYDDIGEESMYEFASMKATSNAEAETAAGRDPREMCRPTASTRGGFMESHGAGIQIITSASLALEMGVPIYGVVAMTNTATDREGRSIPAPGQGILTTCREQASKFPNPLLDVSYRKRQLERSMRHVANWEQAELEYATQEAEQLASAQGSEAVDAFMPERRAMIQREVERQQREARQRWGNRFYRGHADIAPLRGALAAFGLTIDDLKVASFHGTGTKLNDKNESDIVQQQMTHLGRVQGNPLYVVAQKSVTGHPKGAAAGWMMNGVLQCLSTGRVPGNLNLDNVAEELAGFSHLTYPNRAVNLKYIPAALMKSFGFGQAGAEVLVLHPNVLYAFVETPAYDAYTAKLPEREKHTQRAYHRMLTGKQTLVQVKTFAPYSDAEQNQVYLDPLARASFDADAQTYTFSSYSHLNRRSSTAAIPEDTRSAMSEAGSFVPSYDRREAETLLSAMRRGKGFGLLRNPAEQLEERHMRVTNS